jgi:hypothetical protein
VQITINALTANRDAVLLRWSARSGAAPAGPASSATAGALAGMVVSRCAAGQIVESWAQWDQPGVLALLQHTGPSDRVPTPAGW